MGTPRRKASLGAGDGSSAQLENGHHDQNDTKDDDDEPHMPLSAVLRHLFRLGVHGHRVLAARDDTGRDAWASESRREGRCCGISLRCSRWLVHIGDYHRLLGDWSCSLWHGFRRPHALVSIHKSHTHKDAPETWGALLGWNPHPSGLLSPSPGRAGGTDESRRCELGAG